MQMQMHSTYSIKNDIKHISALEFFPSITFAWKEKKEEKSLKVEKLKRKLKRRFSTISEMGTLPGWL